MSSVLLEVCVDSLQSVQNAVEGGAGRIELCSCLFKGGLTPSAGLLTMAKSIAKDIPIFVMLRARPGDDFVFTKEEQQVMLADLKILKDIGADGFVYGALNQDGTVNKEFCSAIIKAASPLPVTFHRAFDAVQNDLKSLEDIIELGFKRVLTSAREKSVADKLACERLRIYLHNGYKRIGIIAGAGITASNVKSVLETGVEEIHGSFKMFKQLPIFYNLAVRESIEVTDKMHVETVVKFLNNS